MMSTYSVACPRCGRDVTVCGGVYSRHSTTPRGPDTCPMSRLRAIVTGHTEGDYEMRAYLVTHLAHQVQDYDPHEVYDYLTCMSAVELQRMLMIALAAIPVDKSLREVFRWITKLPVAQAVTA